MKRRSSYHPQTSEQDAMGPAQEALTGKGGHSGLAEWFSVKRQRAALTLEHMADVSPAPGSGIVNLEPIKDLWSSTWDPFIKDPDPGFGKPVETGHHVENWFKALKGLKDFKKKALDELTLTPIGASLPSFASPVATLGSMYVGKPHAHAHPPSNGIPLLSTGMVLGPGAISVLVGGAPPARAGDFGLAFTCGTAAPPFEIMTGSSSVFMGGGRTARLGDWVRHCNPVEQMTASLQKWNKINKGVAGAGIVAAAAGGNVRDVLQGAADMAADAIKSACGKDPGIPPGWGMLVVSPAMLAGVLVGGFPVPTLSGMFSAGKALRATKLGTKLAGFRAWGRVMNVVHRYRSGKLKALQRLQTSKALDSLGKRLPGGLQKRLQGSLADTVRNAQNAIARIGDPVHLVTGEVVLEHLDYASGRLFSWRRHYSSARRQEGGVLGHGFRHFYQRTLVRRLHRVTFHDWDGTRVEFERLSPGNARVASDGYVLQRLGLGHFRVSRKGQPDLEFLGHEFDTVLKLTRVTTASCELELGYAGPQLERIAERSPETKIAGAAERLFELEYDDSGRVMHLWEAVGGKRQHIRASYGYAPSGDLMLARDALGKEWVCELDAVHRLTAHADPHGRRFEFRYDASHRCIKTSGQHGFLQCRIAYFAEENRSEYVDALNVKRQVFYDELGIITKLVEPDGTERSWSTDGLGRIVSEVTLYGEKLRWLYDDDGFHYARMSEHGELYPPLEEAPALEHPARCVLPNTFEEFLLGYGWAAPEEKPGVSATPWLDERLQRLACDLFQDRDDGSQTGSRGTFRRDDLGRVVSGPGAVRGRRQFVWDESGKPSSAVDADGNLSRFEMGRSGLTTGFLDALGHRVGCDYDNKGQVIAWEDPAGNRTEYHYDERGRPTVQMREGRLFESYEYDRWDNVVTRRDAEGRVAFTATAHRSGRLGERELANGGLHRYDYDPSGKVTEASTEKHVVQLAYDAYGAVRSDVRDGLGVTVKRTKDGTVQTELLGKFRYEIHATSEKLTLVGPAGTCTRLERHGPLVRRLAGNGTEETLRFSRHGNLQASLLLPRLSRPGEVELTLRYTYSAEGDLLEEEDSTKGCTRFEFDSAHRLRRQTLPSGKQNAFLLDSCGNLQRKPGAIDMLTGAGNRLTSTWQEAFEYDGRGRLSRRTAKRDGVYVELSYDSFDRLVGIERKAPPGHSLRDPSVPGKGVPSYAEDFVPHSASAVAPHCSEFLAAYDGLGRRLCTEFRDAAGERRRREFYWEGERLAAEVLPSGILRFYHYVDRDALCPVEFTDFGEGASSPPLSGKTYCIFYAASGMPRRVEDSEGRAVWLARSMDPYGLLELVPRQDIELRYPGASIEFNLRWPGHYFDPETALHYNRYRYYDPLLGRYLRPDPSGHEGSPVNLYACSPSPMCNVDVQGLSCDIVPTRLGLGPATTLPNVQKGLSRVQALAASVGAGVVGYGASLWQVEQVNHRNDSSGDSSPGPQRRRRHQGTY